MDTEARQGKPGRRVAFRAFLFGKDGRIQNVAIIEAAGELQAVEIARRMVRGYAVELWDQARMIGRFDPQHG